MRDRVAESSLGREQFGQRAVQPPRWRKLAALLELLSIEQMRSENKRRKLATHVHDHQDMNRFKLSFKDFVHAFVLLLVFTVFALSNSNVQSCFFPGVGAYENALWMNLPLGAGILSSFLFTIFPTKRRSIGYADMSGYADV